MTDLTTLANLRTWLQTPAASVADDALLGRLITAASDFINTYTSNTSFDVQSGVDVLDGSGSDFLLLRRWPVLSVESLQFSGMTITAADTTTWPPTSGFILEPPPSVGAQQRLQIYGYCFPRGRGLIRVSYTSGTVATDEPAVIPATPYQVTTDAMWLSDRGVKTSAGVAMTKVASNPVTGQYAVSATGLYTFAAADTGKTVLITYGKVPPTIEQCCIELAGERYKARGRIGVNSQSLAGKESITYFQRADMNTYVKTALQQFERVTPS